MKFELCTDSVEGAIMAAEYNFTSIELCTALSVGGLTPSFGLIQACAEHTTAEVHAMIRHKEGEFTCDDRDIELMKHDILAVHRAGGHGVVFGVLNEASEVSDQNLDLVQTAKNLGLKTTFHRAFDFCPEPELAIEKLTKIGFDRLLSSGLRPKAIEGIELLSKLQSNYGSEIQILAGSGVDENNAIKFKQAGLDYIHFTSRKAKNKTMSLGMGQYQETDPTKIKKVLSLFE